MQRKDAQEIDDKLFSYSISISLFVNLEEKIYEVNREKGK